MEELQFYLDLVNELGDPFTIFERESSPEPSLALRGDPVDPAVSEEPYSWFDG